MTSTPVTPTAPSLLCLAHVSRQPLKWLWPNRIPLGHLTLLDAAPDCGLSLFTLTLAAKLSRGTLPDGTATQPATILLIAPYETAEDTILPRFEAAGGDLTRLTPIRTAETCITTMSQPSPTQLSSTNHINQLSKANPNTERTNDVRLLTKNGLGPSDIYAG